MYKIKTLLFACSLLPLVWCCNGDPDTHELSPSVQPVILYADDTLDSLSFYTFDSWTVTPQADWITIAGDAHMDIKYNNTKRYLCKVFVKTLPNTTGRTRSGSVLVQSYDYSYSTPVVQLGQLNVSHPARTVDTWLDDLHIVPLDARYVLTDSAHWTRDSICFTVQDRWELTFVDGKPDWLDFYEETNHLPGTYSVLLTLVPNQDKEHERETTLCLTSGGIANTITVRQLRAQK